MCGVGFWANHLIPRAFHVLGVGLHRVGFDVQGPRFIV